MSGKEKKGLSSGSIKSEGAKPYRCDVCQKEFYWGGSLRRHQRIHSGEKPYTCSTCGKRFTQSGTLNRHSRTHAGKQLFPCPHCPRKFNTSQALAQHAINHDHDTPLPPTLRLIPPSAAGERPSLRPIPPPGERLSLRPIPPPPAGERPSLRRIPPSAAGERLSLRPVPPAGERPSSSSSASSQYDDDLLASLTLWEANGPKFHMDDQFLSTKIIGAGGDNVPISTSFAFDAQMASRLEEPVNLDIVAAEVGTTAPSSSPKISMLVGTPPADIHPIFNFNRPR